MLTWHCQTKTLAKLDTQVQHLQGDIDYGMPALQQQILELNGVGELVIRCLETPSNLSDTPTSTSGGPSSTK